MRVISSRNDLQVNIRMPATLKSLLRCAACDEGRSLNTEILKRLSESFSMYGVNEPWALTQDREFMKQIMDERGGDDEKAEKAEKAEKPLTA